MRASIAAIPRSRSGETASARPNRMGTSSGRARTCAAVRPSSPSWRIPAKPRVVGDSEGSRLYWALGLFVATSVAIGIVAVSSRQYAWIPLVFGLAGAGLLLYASMLLVRESQVALEALDAEMDFVWQLGTSHATPELLELHRRRW